MRISGALIIDFQKKVSNRLRKSRIFRPFMKLSPLNQRTKDRRISAGSKGVTFTVSPSVYAGMNEPKPRVVGVRGITQTVGGRPAMNLKGELTLVNRRKGDRRGGTKPRVTFQTTGRKLLSGKRKK